MIKRCRWAENVPQIYQDYHDHQWGVATHKDSELFEMLILESFHTGLSWLIILKKREAFRQAFDSFDAEKIAKYDEKKVQELMGNPQIVRNEKKIRAAISNAEIFLAISKEYGSFDAYLQKWANHRIHYKQDHAVRSELSDAVSADLKKRGFKFMGSITTQSYLEAVGVICAHEKECFLYREEEK